MMKVRNLFHQTKVEVRVPKITQLLLLCPLKKKYFFNISIACESNEAKKIFILLSNEPLYIVYLLVCTYLSKDLNKNLGSTTCCPIKQYIIATNLIFLNVYVLHIQKKTAQKMLVIHRISPEHQTVFYYSTKK